jgi:hypothetical protein
LPMPIHFSKKEHIKCSWFKYKLCKICVSWESGA